MNSPEVFEIQRGRFRMRCESSQRDALEKVGALDRSPQNWSCQCVKRYCGRGQPMVLRMDEIGEVVVKAFVHGGALGRLKGGLFSGATRLWREWDLSRFLGDRGVRTPRVIFARSERAFGPFYRLLIGTENIPNSVDLRHVWNESASVRVALEGAGKVVSDMHDSRVLHVDLNMGNILVRGSDAWVIDLDRCRRLKVMNREKRIKNLLRLWRSAQKLEAPATVTNVARFLRSYSRDGWRSYFEEIQIRSHRVFRWHRVRWGLNRKLASKAREWR